MKTALFLDDMDTRYKRILTKYPDVEIDWAQTASIAMGLLSTSIHNPYETIMLDHDLGTDPVTGMHVAAGLCCFQAVYKDTQIILHTSNPVGAKRMKSIFVDCDFTNILIISFEELTRAPF